MTHSLLSVRNLTRRYAAQGPAAVDGVSFDLAQGEILALIGPSGCGKTTTLRMIAGFEASDAGQVLLAGRDISGLPPELRGIGMVFQDYALFPHMTVAQNILFGVRDGDLDAMDRYLDMVGMTGFGGRYPDELSGGQQQRVALARSFAAGPRLILLDEPFSNLDAALRGATRREIRHLLKAAGMGIVFVTHDQEEALSFADRVAVMREGRLLQTGTPQQVYDCPADTFVATFLGRANLLTGMVVGGVCDTPLGTLQIAAPDGPATLSIRPEHLRLWLPQAGEAATGRVSTVEFKGHDSTYWIDCAGTNVQVDVMRGPRLEEGTPVVIGIAGDIHCIARS